MTIFGHLQHLRLEDSLLACSRSENARIFEQLHALLMGVINPGSKLETLVMAQDYSFNLVMKHGRAGSHGFQR